MGADVVVAGAGPAGWAVASACARAGLRTVLVDPAPHARWRPTYALWRDEMPDIPDGAIAAAPARTIAYGKELHEIPREYVVVRNDGLRRWLARDDVETVTGQVTGATHGSRGSTVTLADGRRLAAAVVFDATGARRMLSGGPPRRRSTEQTAFGLVLDAADAEPLVPDAAGTAVLMDWRGAARDPGFLYSVPLGDGRVLVEETSLARRPGLSANVLATRLRARFAKAGVPLSGVQEWVRIPLDLPLPRPGRTVPFGVAAGLVHPATGYSLATSLTLAPEVAAAVADNLRSGPAAASRAARRAIWPPAALAVYALRRHGLRALRAMPPDETARFFDLFFALPAGTQRAFTSGRGAVPETRAAMSELFRKSPWRLRVHLAR
jgi:lycopene beta-cyclase